MSARPAALVCAAAVFSCVVRAGEPSPSTISLMRTAAAAFRDGRLDEALSLTVKVLDREPDNGAAKNFAWTIARKIGEEENRTRLDPAAKKAGTRLALRDMAERRRRTKGALAELERESRRSRRVKSPSDILQGMTGLEKLLGEEYASERDEAAANAYFNEILDNLSMAVRKGGGVSKAVQYRAEGFLAYYRRDWKTAEVKWEAALKENPDDPQVRKDLKSLREVMRRMETDARIRELIRQAETYEDTGYLREAADSWEAVMKLDPSRPGAREKWTVARVAAEKADLRETLRLMTAKGVRLYQQGDFVGGAQVWLEALQKDPGYDQARRWLAQVGPKLRAEAVSPPPPAEAPAVPRPAAGKPAPQAAPPPAAAASPSAGAMDLYKRGIMFYTEGKLKEAVAAWKEALKVDPSMVKAQQAVRQAETELAFQ